MGICQARTASEAGVAVAVDVTVAKDPEPEKIEREECKETVDSGEPLLKRSRPAPMLTEDDYDDFRVPVFLRVECKDKPALEDFYELCSFQKNDRPVWGDGQNYIYCTTNLQWAVAMDEDGVNGDRGWLYDNLGGADKKYPDAVRSWMLYDGKDWNKTQARIHVSPPPNVNVECVEKADVNGCYMLMDPRAELPMWGCGHRRLYLNEATSHWAICLQAVTVAMGGAVVRSGANEAVMNTEGEQEMPNMIYSWDYHDGEAWTRSSTRITATKRPPPPRLVVVCPDKPTVDGTYKLKREKINDFSCWNDGDNYIYQTSNKAWAVCIGWESTQKDQGWMYAKDRESKFPDKVSKWDVYDGEAWQSSPGSSVTIPTRDKTNPPAVAVYKPQIAEEVETFIVETRNKGGSEQPEEEVFDRRKSGGRGAETSQDVNPAADTTAAPSRMGDTSESDVRILPNTAWNEIPVTRSCLKELAENAGIRSACPKIESIVEDIANKTKELQYQKLPVKLEEDHLAAVVAYTHDLQSSKGPDGNIYFEMNKALRNRTSAARQATMQVWGPFAHYLIMGLSKLPDFSGECYRGYPNKAEVIKEYELGRPIQWGAFASVTTSFTAAKNFTDRKKGVIFKIAVTSGRQIHQYSFFPDENEVLLTPAHRFTVGSEPYEKDGYTCIFLIQQKKAAFMS
mmetsp:Transcript_56364/g.98443  ORF Transcript_56364/g.98443 Transcript_56364/m.98443 type:complete len:680 (+) Transcript_56364:53-2092(+)